MDDVIIKFRDELKRVTFARLQKDLSLDGYMVPCSFIKLIDETTYYDAAKLLTIEILNDTTGLTAAMYGVNLEDE